MSPFLSASQPGCLCFSNFHLTTPVRGVFGKEAILTCRGISKLINLLGNVPNTPSCQPWHHFPSHFSGNSTPTILAPEKNCRISEVASGLACGFSLVRRMWSFTARATGNDASRFDSLVRVTPCKVVMVEFGIYKSQSWRPREFISLCS